MAATLTPRRVAVAGVLLAGVLSVAGVLAAGDGGGRDRGSDRGSDRPASSSAPTSFPASRAAAESFVDAWRDSLTGTYVLVSRFRREQGGEVRFESETVTAQRPPERVVTGGGNVDARLGGERVACGTDAEGTLRCRAEPAGSYEAFVEATVGRVADLVLGSSPLYAVAPGDGGGAGDSCFRLLLRFALPAPPYGDAARFCFDAATGAQIEAVILRESDDVIDRTERVSLRAAVGGDDLRLPEGAVVG